MMITMTMPVTYFIMLQKVVVLIGGVTMPIFAITGLADHKE
jgi:hypothetical protein